MKKAVIWILIANLVFMFLVGCASTSRLSRPITPHNLSAPSFELPEDIVVWIYRNIHYDHIPKTELTVQTPEETLRKGSGSCYDMSKLAIKLMIDNGYAYCQPRLLCVQIAGRAVLHMIVDAGSCGYLDPTYGRVYLMLPDGWSVYPYQYR